MSEELKKSISEILMAAVNGTDEDLRLDGKYIRWGLVERRIHELIDQADSLESKLERAREMGLAIYIKEDGDAICYKRYFGLVGRSWKASTLSEALDKALGEL